MVLACESVQEVLSQGFDILSSLTQGWKTHAHYVQAIEEIFSESILFNLLFETLVGSDNHPYIHLNFVDASHPAESVLFQDPWFGIC